MGSYFSRTVDDVKHDMSHAAVSFKLVDLKMQKKQRDTMIATKIATTRDRCHYLVAFYSTYMLANLARRKVMKLKTFEPMPFAYLPFIATPYIFLYQMDFAYGTKSERINVETNRILKEEYHWFNKPLVLPAYLKEDYDEMCETQNKKLQKLGLNAQKDWAIFVDGVNVKEEDLQENVSMWSFALDNIFVHHDHTKK